jgi:hypothetical protein
MFKDTIADSFVKGSGFETKELRLTELGHSVVHMDAQRGSPSLCLKHRTTIDVNTENFSSKQRQNHIVCATTAAQIANGFPLCRFKIVQSSAGLHEFCEGRENEMSQEKEQPSKNALQVTPQQTSQNQREHAIEPLSKIVPIQLRSLDYNGRPCYNPFSQGTANDLIPTASNLAHSIPENRPRILKFRATRDLNGCPKKIGILGQMGYANGSR